MVIKFVDSGRTYYVDSNGNVYEYTYHDLAIMEDGFTFYNRMADYRELILNVEVVDYLEVPDSAVESFDVSQNQDKSVMAWLIVNEDDNSYYDLYIGGDDGVKASSCSYMFSGMSKCVSIDLEYFYTENVQNFAGMFANCTSLTYINLSNLDTSSATSMNSMFGGCSSLDDLDVSNFDTSKVTNMGGMFEKVSVETIDLSSFNTSKVKSMNSMFKQCPNLKELDLSEFDTSNVERTDSMFNGCSKLETIYVSEKWSNDNNTLSSYMFTSCSKLKGAISYDSSKVDITYANYTDGYFTYKEGSSVAS